MPPFPLLFETPCFILDRRSHLFCPLLTNTQKNLFLQSIRINTRQKRCTFYQLVLVVKNASSSRTMMEPSADIRDKLKGNDEISPDDIRSTPLADQLQLPTSSFELWRAESLSRWFYTIASEESRESHCPPQTCRYGHSWSKSPTQRQTALLGLPFMIRNTVDPSS